MANSELCSEKEKGCEEDFVQFMINWKEDIDRTKILYPELDSILQFAQSNHISYVNLPSADLYSRLLLCSTTTASGVQLDHRGISYVT